MPYTHLERTIMGLNSIIRDVYFDRALETKELDALAMIAKAKALLQEARAKLDQADAEKAKHSIEANQIKKAG